MDTFGEQEIQAYLDDKKEGVKNPGFKCVGQAPEYIINGIIETMRRNFA